MEKLDNDILEKRLGNLSDILKEKGIFKKRNIKDTDEGKKKSFSFVVYTLQRFLDTSAIDEIMEYITDGSNDNNIDILHIDDDYDEACININIFQVKYKIDKNLSGTIGANDVNLFLLKVKEIFIENKELNLPSNDFLSQQYNRFKQLLNSDSNSNINIKCYFVTNGADLNQPEKENINKFKQENHVIKEIEILNKRNFFIENDRPVKEITIPITEDPISMNTTIASKVVNIKTYHLAKLYHEYQDDILEKNVRKLLSSKTNKDIKDSFLKEPKNFWYKNNGLSIVCKRMEVKKAGGHNNLTLENPYIVNGGQTTKTIYNIFKECKEDNEEEMKSFYEAIIMARIYQTTDEDMIASIVYGTNNQNKIVISDLKSLNPKVNKIKDLFKEYDINLITKRDSEYEKKPYEITAELLLQIYCAMYEKIPHKSKISKSRLIQDYFDNVYGNTEIFKDLLNCVCYYYFINSQKNKQSEFTIKQLHIHGVYAILYTMFSLKQNELTSISTDNKQLKDTYEKTLKILNEIIKDQQKNIDFSFHNFFKALKSTTLINDYVSK